MEAEARPREEKPPLSAVLGTILFVAVVPGTVVVFVPWYLSRWKFLLPLLGTDLTRWLGLGLIVAGLPVFVQFLLRFVREGHGTPAPVAPPKRLVVGGPFRYVRNPGYLGGLAMIAGQGFLFGNLDVLAYAALVALAFHLFVVAYEEPTLRRTFGTEYEEYCRTVPRWMPRLRQRPPGS
jgi:protein-S-isoprenylcysteine O-methyltransferase Ste14